MRHLFLAALLCLAGVAHAAGRPGHFVFQVDTARVPDVDARWFGETLVQMEESGQNFAAGETLLVGPVLLKIEDAGEGKLKLLEPDMQAMPFNYVDSVTRTLVLLRRQRDTLASYDADAEPDFAPLHEPLLIDERALKAQSITLVRRKPEAGLTGWVIVDADSDPKSILLRPMSVYEAMLALPAIDKFLALPPGYSVTITLYDFTVRKDGKEVHEREGSFIDLLRKRQ